MAKVSLAMCLLLLVTFNVVYEVQGTFLLRHYLRKCPLRSREFRPFACKGMLLFCNMLEHKCPLTSVYKNFFGNLRSYMSFINSASGSANFDVELKGRAEGLQKSISALSSNGGSSGDSSKVMEVLLSMGKTLGPQQSTSPKIFSFGQRRELIISMVRWARVISQFVSSTTANSGNSIDLSSLGIDGVDVNGGSSPETAGSVPSSGTPTGGSPYSSSGTPTGGSPYPSSGTPSGGSPYAGSGTPSSGSPYASSGTPSGGSPSAGSGTPSSGSPYASSGTPSGGSPSAGSGTPSGGTPYANSGTSAGGTASGTQNGSSTNAGSYMSKNTNAGTTSGDGTSTAGSQVSSNGEGSTSKCATNACSNGGGTYSGKASTDSSFKGSLNYQGQQSSQHTMNGSS